MNQSENLIPANRFRLLWVSESPRLHTGFGRVADELTWRLGESGRFDVGLLGWGCEDQPDSSASLPYTTYSPGPRPWDPDQMDRVVDSFGPDVLVTAGPLSAQCVVPRLRTRPFVSWAGYAFFEAGPLRREDQEALGEMDQVVVPSTWCQRMVEDCEPTAGVRQIPLGVDSETFRPLPERETLRAAAGLAGKFVVGCVARNEFRKQIPILIKAFARFAKAYPEAVLYLHMEPDDQGWRLLELLHRYGLLDRTAFTQGLAHPMGVTSAALNRIYNLFDVMAVPTMGEAFGLSLLEAMAAGVPVLATDCSAVPELLASRGELIKVRTRVTMTWDEAEYAVANEEDMLDKLTRLRADPDRRERYAQRGREFALGLTWQRTADGWMDLLKELLGAVRADDDAGDRVWVRTVRV